MRYNVMEFVSSLDVENWELGECLFVFEIALLFKGFLLRFFLYYVATELSMKRANWGD